MYAMEQRVQMVLRELLVRKEQPVHKVLRVLLVLQVLMEPTERMDRTHWLKLRPSPLPITALMVA
jgi:hypothetical protein